MSKESHDNGNMTNVLSPDYIHTTHFDTQNTYLTVTKQQLIQNKYSKRMPFLMQLTFWCAK